MQRARIVNNYTCLLIGLVARTKKNQILKFRNPVTSCVNSGAIAQNL